MIFVDSNIPMYLVGADHPNKAIARRLLEKCIANGERLVADAEVLREILHRYTAINRRDAIQPAFDALHAAIMQRHEIDRILSFDSGFDGLAGIERIATP